MEKIIVNGGKKLCGTLPIDTAKNAVLAELASCMLCSDEVEILQCPNISDVDNMVQILHHLGATSVRTPTSLKLNMRNANGYEVKTPIAQEIRSSIFLLGSILGRHKQAVVAYPGGCEIGIRPIDLHLKGLRALGVQIEESNGYIICNGKNMHAGDIHLDSPSVGATENLMMVATLIKGTTRISNVAREPEIVDLARFINSMGGKIKGAGEPLMQIEGVDSLHSAVVTPIPDRIIAGTYLIACAMTGGEIELTNVEPAHLTSLISKLEDCGCKIYCDANRVALKMDKRLEAPQIVETLPYPGFPTDLQAQLTAMCSVANGSTMVIENIFESRFKFVNELHKMGANIFVRDRSALVTGVNRLNACTVNATDLRGGASLVLAGLVAKGTTCVQNVHYIDRGYNKIENHLTALGADISRVG